MLASSAASAFHSDQRGVILRAYQTLQLEPWCFTPADVALLTDWQIEHEYLLPAKERMERLKAEREQYPPLETKRKSEHVETERDHSPVQSSPGAPSPLPRAYLVGVMTSYLGMPIEDANAEYDRQFAEWRRQQRERMG